MKTIDRLVKEVLDEHKEGEKFFENLDEKVRDKKWCQALWTSYVKSGLRDNMDFIVMSGRFGQLFYNFLVSIGVTRPIFLVRGGLRRNPELDDLNSFELSGTRFVFFDDSLYAGRTRDAIHSHLVDLGSKGIQHTFVIYDGSEVKEESVHSLYRYWDNEE